MINVYSLGSGSKGNSILISDGKNNILIDAGLTLKNIKKKLAELSLGLGDISGVLITHEHGDHIRSVADIGSFLPIYSHNDTIDAIRNVVGSIKCDFRPIDESPFTVWDYEITPFCTSHDAVHPFGYVIDNGKEKFAYCTDTGFISRGVMKHLVGCKSVMIESNHDRELLLRGPYSEKLKRRIMSDKGHLCNNETALTVCDLVKSGTERIMLAHLSEQNNLVELAYWTTVRQLTNKGIKESDVNIKVALQKETVII